MDAGFALFGVGFSGLCPAGSSFAFGGEPALAHPRRYGAALHQLFQTKRKSSGVVLAAAPVTLLLTVATVGLFAVSQVDNGASESAFPVVVIAGGLGATSALLSRYIRYTKGREAAMVSKYERTHVLAGWVKRNLARQKPLTQ
ncbi:hypothetical protein [Hymenobacter negativus]|uniref:Uncharacterized protein n=1 Tax=Hymenobacter negativus TaxID=2795026 RepID=A0ABS0Q7D9_9BACT|nr:hypothetical protein [Hymenobacter negativus]MBH8558576.1 hypothetical protein [Hymenobacter negativus]